MKNISKDWIIFILICLTIFIFSIVSQIVIVNSIDSMKFGLNTITISNKKVGRTCLRRAKRKTQVWTDLLAGVAIATPASYSPPYLTGGYKSARNRQQTMHKSIICKGLSEIIQMSTKLKKLTHFLLLDFKLTKRALM